MKSVGFGLSGALVAVLLSAGQAAAGGATLSTTLTSSKTVIYQNESLTLNATLEGLDNSSDCTAQVPTLTAAYKDGGDLLCNNSVTSTQLGPYHYRYEALPCVVSGSSLTVGTHVLSAEGNSSYCYNSAGQTANRVTVTVLAGNAPVSVPTVGEWTLWGMMALMLVGGGAILSRRFRPA